VELFKPLSPVIQVFLLIAAGFVFAHRKKISLTSVTEIIVYLGTPSLVFSSLASRPLFAGDIVVYSPAYYLSSQESGYSYDSIFSFSDSVRVVSLYLVCL